MTPDEQEVVKVGAEAVMRPFSNLIEKLFGGGVQQLGGMLEDAVKVRRFRRQVKLFKKLQEILDQSGFEPRQVPDKIWMPILESVATEDDDALQEQWANLLANAADPRNESQDLASFVQILKQLSSRDAKLLQVLYKETRGSMIEPNIWQHYVVSGLSRVKDVFISPSEGAQHSGDLTADYRDFGVTLDRLLYLRLLDREIREIQVEPHIERTRKEMEFNLTNLGEAFVRACTRPKVSVQP